MEISHSDVYGMVKSGISVGAALFANAAVQRDSASVTWIGKSKGIIEFKNTQYIVDTAVLNESASGSAIVQDKEITKELLKLRGIRTPEGAVVDSAESAIEIARKLGRNVVIKPSRGGMGNGVSVDLANDDEIREAFKLAENCKKGKVLVEEHIDIQDEYRCMASSTECVAVVHRILPQVIGDGQSTVRQLIQAKNKLRRENAAMYSFPIPINSRTTSTLQKQNATLDEVLPVDRVITVSNVGGLSGGAEPHEVLDTVSEEVKLLAYRTVEAIPGLNWGGVDIVTEKGTGTPYVIEVNTCAGYGAATYPLEGTPRDVASYAWHQRLSITEPDQKLSPDRNEPEGSSNLVALAEIYPSLDFGSGVLASHLLPIWAEKSKYEIIQKGLLRVVIDHNNKEHWISAELATSNDLLAPRRILRQHALVSKILKHNGSSHPDMQFVRSPDYLQDLLRNQTEASFVLPSREPWATRKTKVYRRPLKRGFVSRMFDQSSTWIIQPRPAAYRFRVVSDRTETMAVLSVSDGSPKDALLEKGLLHQLSELAVRSIRAVPELQWAFVDIAVHVNDGLMAVEGLSSNPVLRGSDQLLAGQLENFFRSKLVV